MPFKVRTRGVFISFFFFFAEPFFIVQRSTETDLHLMGFVSQMGLGDSIVSKMHD